MAERLPPFFVIRGNTMAYTDNACWELNTVCEECGGKNSKALYLQDCGGQYTYCYKCNKRTVLRASDPLVNLLTGGKDNEFNTRG